MMDPVDVKTLLIAAAALVVVTCGDTTAAPETTPSESGVQSRATAATTATAIASPVQAQAEVTFLNGPLAVARGGNATLQVKTAPNTLCSIEVDYKSGPSTAGGLVPKTSDSASNVSWTWKVGANTTPGAWPIIVTCGSASAQTNITVT
jgi:micrococcal nuclease